MDFSQDHFALFGLPRCYALDQEDLARRYRELQALVHPDKHAHLSDGEQRLAMQWTTRLNEAYQVLRRPLSRAKYLLGLEGIDVDAGREMAGEFLAQQIERREAVAQARAAGDCARLEQLEEGLRCDLEREYDELARAMASDKRADPRAAEAVRLLRQLMFQEKLLADIDDALAAVAS